MKLSTYYYAIQATGKLCKVSQYFANLFSKSKGG